MFEIGVISRRTVGGVYVMLEWTSLIDYVIIDTVMSV